MPILFWWFWKQAISLERWYSFCPFAIWGIHIDCIFQFTWNYEPKILYFIFKTEAAECPAIFCKNGASNILSLLCKKMEILFERTHSLGHKFNNALNSFFCDNAWWWWWDGTSHCSRKRRKKFLFLKEKKSVTEKNETAKSHKDKNKFLF